MKIWLTLGGLRFCLDSELPLELGAEEIGSFVSDPEREADVTVKVTWDWEGTRHPRSKPIGRDLIQIYYREEADFFCEVDGGDRGALSCVHYREDFRQLQCAVNHVTCPVLQNDVAHILRMLPMRAIFQHFGVLFFHAAQIAVCGTGILFTAPSGTGKTTQAQLWQKHRGAALICNDRTLVGRKAPGWQTYGYPVDGSSPVCSGECFPLGAVVLLEQGKEADIQRMQGAKAIAALLPMVVMDGWDSPAHLRAVELLCALLEQVPVYRLCATPDQQSVCCLETQLRKDEVITFAENK